MSKPKDPNKPKRHRVDWKPAEEAAFARALREIVMANPRIKKMDAWFQANQSLPPDRRRQKATSSRPLMDKIVGGDKWGGQPGKGTTVPKILREGYKPPEPRTAKQLFPPTEPAAAPPVDWATLQDAVERAAPPAESPRAHDSTPPPVLTPPDTITARIGPVMTAGQPAPPSSAAVNLVEAFAAVLGDVVIRALSSPQVATAVVELLTPALASALAGRIGPVVTPAPAPAEPKPQLPPTIFESAGRSPDFGKHPLPTTATAEDERDDDGGDKNRPTILVAVPHTKYNEEIKRTVKSAAKVKFWTLDKSVDSLRSMATNCEMAVGVDGIHYSHRQIMRERSPHYLGDASGVTRVKELILRALVTEQATAP